VLRVTNESGRGGRYPQKPTKHCVPYEVKQAIGNNAAVQDTAKDWTERREGSIPISWGDVRGTLLGENVNKYHCLGEKMLP